MMPLAFARNYSTRFRLPPTIHDLVSTANVGQPVSLTAWVKSIRKQKRVAFGVLSDGSSAAGLQAVFNDGLKERVKDITNGTSLHVTGKIVESPGTGQDKELHVEDVQILGPCDQELYPIQKKSLTAEYLRDHTHIRARTDVIAAMLRLRGRLLNGINRYLADQSFTYAHTPILTSGDAEGGGEAFRIASMSQDASLPERDREFFSRPSYLTVSHQLHLEALCSALTRVYTLGPCFRAERGVTRRHLAEFWMLEAEWGVPPANDPRRQTASVCDFVEGLLRGVVGDSGLLDDADMDLLWRHREHDSASVEIRERRRQGLVKAVTSDTPWPKISYSEAVRELLKVDRTWNFPVGWGNPLQTEHEKWLSEELIGGPVFITDYPASLKPFYMRANPPAEDEERSTVGCFDLLVPHAGELVGGSVREDRFDVLRASMLDKGMDPDGERYGWYCSLRQFGGAPHVGFGLGFERLVGWVGGVENVRECIPMPRWAGRMEM
ncbi:Asparaginyl-tRNA synthetase [Mycena kentingensis (nom. inval.)]|nr:Asparaginyl-tRNA synthetase [Mycena kentingensis (nom. inval.)]